MANPAAPIAPPRPTRTAVTTPRPATAATATPGPTAPPPKPAPVVESRRVGATFSLSVGPGSVMPLFVQSFRSVLYARKTPFLFLFMLLPAWIGLIINGASGLDEYPLFYNSSWGGRSLDATGGLLWFQDGSFGILFPFLLPMVVAVFASGAIGEEVEGKTLPYLFTRPVYRNWILLAKALAIYLAVFLMAAAALTAFWFMSVSFTESPLTHIGQLFGTWWVALLAVLASGGIFLFLGVLWRRAIVLITVYLFVWELAMSNLPAKFFKRASLVSYERPILRAVTERTPSFDDVALGVVSPFAAHVILLLLALGGLAAAVYVVSNKDYNV